MYPVSGPPLCAIASRGCPYVRVAVQCLDLEVDVDKAALRGRTSIWLRHLPNPSANGRYDYDSYPAEVALHCRQSKVMLTKVNLHTCNPPRQFSSTLVVPFFVFFGDPVPRCLSDLDESKRSPNVACFSCPYPSHGKAVCCSKLEFKY